VPEKHFGVPNWHARVGSAHDHSMASRPQTKETFMPSLRIAFKVLGAVCALALLPIGAQAESYPGAGRPITLVVGYPPGGSTDLTARVVAEELGSLLKTTIVVENQGGAGGAVAAQRVARAAPDGHTLMVGANNELIINQYINREVKYDGLKDFTPIGLVASQPLVLVATVKSGVRNAQEFVETVQRNPGRFSYGSSGVGTSLHLLGELIKDKAKLDLVHVPYRGVAPLTNDLLGDNIEYGVFVLSSGLPHIRSGKLVAIGTSDAKRSAITPEIPALGEHPAMKGLDVNTWFMLVAPPGLPQPVAERLRRALDEALRSPKLRQKLEAAGSAVTTTQPPDLAAFMSTESAKFRHMVDIARIKP
jgi:tripartite-type tricarboxylate transporter receptor subunit TctC